MMVPAEKIFSAAIDYLLTRKDVDGKRLAVLGVSWGGYWSVWLLKTPKGREKLEIFAPPPYRRGHDHNSFRPRFPALVPYSQPRLTGA
jgi:dienelactone hydrolase